MIPRNPPKPQKIPERIEESSRIDQWSQKKLQRIQKWSSKTNQNLKKNPTKAGRIVKNRPMDTERSKESKNDRQKSTKTSKKIPEKLKGSSRIGRWTQKAPKNAKLILKNSTKTQRIIKNWPVNTEKAPKYRKTALKIPEKLKGSSRRSWGEVNRSKEKTDAK